jgi:hypothetical protein
VRYVTNDFGLIQIIPDEQDLVIHASGPAEIIDGEQLHDVWQQIVTSTHPDHIRFSNLQIDPKIFLPLDLKRFMGVRVRAVSGVEKHGPNNNGDAWTARELEHSHQTFLGKGFYSEHNSYDPANALGILAHAEWLPFEQYVLVVGLIDKIRHARKADQMREQFRNGQAGVSMGCIAGRAICSKCGNVARQVTQLCAHMNRHHPNYMKGKRQGQQMLAYDLCEDVTFYELSHTRMPADIKALPFVVMGADIKDEKVVHDEPKAEGEPKGEPKPTTEQAEIAENLTPDQPTLDKWTEKAFNEAVKIRMRKVIKDEVYKELEPIVRKMQTDIRPVVQEIVETKKEQAGAAVKPEPVPVAS